MLGANQGSLRPGRVGIVQVQYPRSCLADIQSGTCLYLYQGERNRVFLGGIFRGGALAGESVCPAKSQAVIGVVVPSGNHSRVWVGRVIDVEVVYRQSMTVLDQERQPLKSLISRAGHGHVTTNSDGALWGIGRQSGIAKVDILGKNGTQLIPGLDDLAVGGVSDTYR